MPREEAPTCTDNRARVLSWPLGGAALVGAAFAVVYVRALTFGYVEGDDAASVAYHALGRNRAIQLPYSPWHGLMDRWLALFPAQESILRHAALITTAVGAGIATLLLIVLVYELAEISGREKEVLTTAALLLAVPELFYLGLIYEPSMIALAFVLAAHLVARRAMPEDAPVSLFLAGVSVVLFGLGAGCRWDVAAYGTVIVADLSMSRGQARITGSRVQIIRAIMWGLAALLAVGVAIRISGYGLTDVLQTLQVARAEVATRRATGVHLAEVVGAAQTLYTPMMVLCLVVGAFAAWKRGRRLLALFAAGFLPVAPYVYSREPKMLLPLFAPMFALCALGFVNLWYERTRTWKAVLTVIAVVPWIVGVQVSGSGTSYGPGFQRSTELAAHPRLRLELNGGFAVPTPEGPRPLGGHAAVLLGGKWRAFVRDMQSEQRESVQLALQQGMPVVQLDRDAMLLPYLAELGMTTRQPERRILESGPISTRVFRGEGRSLMDVVVDPPDKLLSSATLEQLRRMSPGGRAVLYFSNYANVLRKLRKLAPDSLSVLGPCSAVANLDGLTRIVEGK